MGPSRDQDEGSQLSGSYWVRCLKSSLQDAHRLFPHRIRDRFKLRRQALKLRYWPTQDPTDEGGHLLDLDWSWIEAARGLRIGELRIRDKIGDHDNLRIIFWVPNRQLETEPLPVIWILSVMQKKRNDFTTQNISVFKARRRLVMIRHYGE